MKKNVSKIIPPFLDDVLKAIKSFVGTIKQTPPVYSAVKIAGKPAHRYARQGRTLTLKAREIIIHNIEILNYEYPVLKLKVTTGPGVYIRALARDMGEKLKTGGYLKSLIRTRVANFTLKDSLGL